jgi:hypothetical protein
MSHLTTSLVAAFAASLLLDPASAQSSNTMKPTAMDDVALKKQMLKQAAEYRKLAEKRAVILRMPKPPPPDSDT